MVQTFASTMPPMIVLDDFSFRYSGSTRGLKNICLKVARGDSIAVVGENGAGKSTLVKCMVGILSGTGKYEYEGKQVDCKIRRVLWKKIGMVFQNPSDQLFCPSCREEVAFGPRQMKLTESDIKGRVNEALEAVGLSGFDERSPHLLSAGERKRLAIASVLSMKPEVLILDEPTANLDPHSEELLIQVLSKLDITKILITHDLPLVLALCERTVVLQGGKIVKDYSSAEFAVDEQLVSVNGLDYTFKNDCLMEMSVQQEIALYDARR
jgi:energy-coupling factor transporter ATP-binding protein EcfA2